MNMHELPDPGNFISCSGPYAVSFMEWVTVQIRDSRGRLRYEDRFLQYPGWDAYSVFWRADSRAHEDLIPVTEET